MAGVWLAAASLGGCLYVGSVNHAPVAGLTLETVDGLGSKGQPIKGSVLHLSAAVHDAEDGGTLKAGNWSVANIDGGPSQAGCDYVLVEQPVEPGLQKATLTFYRSANWQVSFVVADRQGALSGASTLMTFIDDDPPSLSSKTVMPAMGWGNSCSAYRAGQPILLAFGGTVEDADQLGSPTCPSTRETIDYHWEIVGLPASSHAVLGPAWGGACADTAPSGSGPTFDPTAASPVCLWPDVIPGGSAQVTTSYSVQMAVRDGVNRDWVKSDPASVAVLPDLPPCMNASDAQPYALEQILGQNESLTLQMPHVDDDLDPYDADHPMSKMTFVWSIHRDSDPVWRVVSGYSLPYYTVDGASYGVGEKVRVRVEARDRTGQAATCDPDSTSPCSSPSACLFGQQCERWITWDLDLR